VLRADTFTSRYHGNPNVALDADGDFVVAWQNSYQDGSRSGVYAQRYGPNEAPAALGIAPIHVEQDAADTQVNLFAAFDDSTDSDALLSYAVLGNTNTALFSSTAINVSPTAATLMLDYAAGRSGAATLTIRVTDQGGLFVDTAFTVTVTVTPAVTAAGFVYASGGTHRVRFTFNQDVQASLSAADLAVRKLGEGGGAVAASSPTYDAATQTATFAFGALANLPNGNYRATLLAAGVTNAAGTPLATDHVIDFFVLAGDVNRDRSVNGSDFAILAGNFGKTGMTYAQGDLTGDGSVNGSDFAILAGNFGRSVPAPAGTQDLVGPTPVVRAVTTPPVKKTAPPPRRVAPAPPKLRRPPRVRSLR
jgi:hypothetical protein